MLTPEFYSTLAELAAHQSRDWFRANRERLRADCERPVLAVLESVAEQMEEQVEGLQLGEARLFRLARDVRFSADKRPYKEHVAGTVALRSGDGSAGVDGAAALFLQIGLEERMAGAGIYMFDSPTLERYRERLLDDTDGAELHARVSALRERGFRPVAGGELKRAPRGVSPEHPRVDLLRLRGLALLFPAWPDGLEHSTAFEEWLAEHAIAALPVVRWLEDCRG